MTFYVLHLFFTFVLNSSLVVQDMQQWLLASFNLYEKTKLVRFFWGGSLWEVVAKASSELLIAIFLHQAMV
jgi:hypothetical protein